MSRIRDFWKMNDTGKRFHIGKQKASIMRELFQKAGYDLEWIYDQMAETRGEFSSTLNHQIRAKQFWQEGHVTKKVFYFYMRLAHNVGETQLYSLFVSWQPTVSKQFEFVRQGPSYFVPKRMAEELDMLLEEAGLVRGLQELLTRDQCLQVQEIGYINDTQLQKVMEWIKKHAEKEKKEKLLQRCRDMKTLPTL